MRSSPTAKPLASLAMLTLFLMALIFVFSSSALAQVVTGTLTGTVVDPNGAVVSGASVTVKSDATGLEKSITTSGDGVFRVENLTPGKYTVTVAGIGGFSGKAVTGVDVKLGQITDIKVDLAVGSTTATVTVTAGTEEIVQRDTSQISSSFEARKVQDLPSNAAGGGIDTLALLAPGVVPGFGNVNNNGTTLSVNGNRARANNFTIDGTDNNDLSIGGPNYFVDNQEIVQEFQVITSNFSAQYGRNQGAIVNIVTKSGGNKFHGSGYEFFRSSATDALTNLEARDPSRGGRRDKIVRNVFGGTFGGPIKKNKIFFFGSYQMLSDYEDATVTGGSLAVLPSQFAALKAQYPNNPAINAFVNQGAFAVTSGGLRTQPRGDVAVEKICLPKDPTLAVDSAAACGTGVNAANDFPVLMARPLFTWSSPYREPEYSIRGDVNPTKKDSVYVRFLHQTSTGKNQVFSNEFLGDLPFQAKNLSGNWTRQISSHASNEFRATYQNLFVKFGGGCTDVLAGCIPDPATSLDKAFTNIGYSGFGASGGTGIRTIGPATNLPQGRLVKVLQFNDNFALTKGRHSFTMGIDLRHLTNSVPFLPNVNGAFAFTSRARLVANAPTRVTLVAGQETLDYKENDKFFFFQDDWKFRPNVTLNLGVRYEYTGQPINIMNQITTARESNSSTAVWRQSLPLSARTFPFIPVDKNNWAPRVGFSYAPHWGEGKLAHFLVGDNDATVVRGGFSIAYDPAFYNILLNVSTSAPMVFNNTINNNASLTAPSFVLPNNPTGDVVRTSLGGFLQKNTVDPRLLTQTIVGPDFHSPYTEQWSFGIQRQVNRNNVFEVRYVGNHGVGLFQTLNRNPFLGANTLNTTATSPCFGQFTNGGLAHGFCTVLPGQTTATIFPAFPQFLQGLTPVNCVDDPATLVDNEGVCNGRAVAGLGLIRSRENTATSSYHGLQTRINGRLAQQVTYGASYTWSKALDNASEIFSFGEGFGAADPLNYGKGERSYSGFDRRHAFAANIIWDLPFFKAQHGFAGKILGGWQANSTWIAASGRRYTPEQIFGINFLSAAYQDQGFDAGVLGFDAVRPFSSNPNASPGSVAITDVDAALFSAFLSGLPFTPSPTGYYSLAALVQRGTLEVIDPLNVRYIFNGPGAAKRFGNPFGNVARNSVLGPVLNQANLGIFKNTKIRENVTLQLRGEFFNVFNHPNPGYGVAAGDSLPSNILDNSAGTTFENKGEMNLSSRRIQFAVRLIF
jgi:outer membrane receptor protein involved in Fe transport